jgi:glycine oxidase
MGRAGQWQNGTIAAGHFRAGIFLSPATAVVMRRLILGEPEQIDLSAFRVDRT